MWWVREGLTEVTFKPIYFLFHHQHSIKPLQGPLIKSAKALGIRMFTAIFSIIVLKIRNNLTQSAIRRLFVKEQVYGLLYTIKNN